MYAFAVQAKQYREELEELRADFAMRIASAVTTKTPIEGLEGAATAISSDGSSQEASLAKTEAKVPTEEAADLLSNLLLLISPM